MYSLRSTQSSRGRKQAISPQRSALTSGLRLLGAEYFWSHFLFVSKQQNSVAVQGVSQYSFRFYDRNTNALLRNTEREPKNASMQIDSLGDLAPRDIKTVETLPRGGLQMSLSPPLSTARL